MGVVGPSWMLQGPKVGCARNVRDARKARYISTHWAHSWNALGAVWKELRPSGGRLGLSWAL
eukprot:6689548-Pyramimonas_sp.AAC.1